MRRLPGVLGVLLLWLSLAAPAQAEKVTFERLLREMVEIERLAELPDPPFITRQFSSYNRASESPADAAGWFADHDRGFPLYDGELADDAPYYRSGPQQGRPADGILRKGTRVGLARNRPAIGDHVYVYATAPNGGPADGRILQGYVQKDAIKLNPDGVVLAEMDGPGAIVRIWSANPADAGVVRVYLDDGREPALAGKLQEILSGAWQMDIKEEALRPFPTPFAGQRGQGWNLYFPLAYQKRCRIVAEKGDLAYHIDYRQYPPDTAVETFTPGTCQRYAGLIRDVQRHLEDRVPRFRNAPQETRTREVRLPPGQLVEVFELEGPAAIQRLQVRLQAEQSVEEALRQIILLAWFDDAASPQICCPLGDFFGSSPGLNPHSSLPVAMQGGALLTANWSMPFAQKARLAVQQHGARPARVNFDVSLVHRDWTPRSLHFHAKWRSWPALRTRPVRDLTLCRLEGQGVLVGEVLSVMNPVSTWWGEGDPKLYVDGERFPSSFGTGTDDHFGMAWRNAAPFQHAYHSQTRCDGPSNFGHSSLNRFRLLDCIPFAKDLRYDLEFAAWDPNAIMSLASVVYWYARPGVKDGFPPLLPADVQALPSPPPLYRIAGAIEGEKLQVRGLSQPVPLDVQDMMAFPDDRWSAAGQLWVRPTRKGVWVDLEVAVPADGSYDVIMHLSKGPEHGIVQFLMNGQVLGKPFDGYQAGAVRASGSVSLGKLDLKRGVAVLRIETVGSHEKSTGPRYAWGLDCIVLKPAM